ncbi:protein borderless isoform X2 [Bombus vosnesenskii]|uniref:Protein borderless isoform X2 n=3 Tax=Pyrobombus TaxID=144703 RepID=A0A6J3KYT4_9HYME|nr:protein borderless isoform X2 [Bombus impatiens]XP_033203978.1 protein borderless isoform X2 [Bombus vancouverensis nearcticus]XP_033312930.1 protein borderless isoform X2 [Bombus bifarius]XP_033358533.1 protein borderless isoform X2 [Bombus vosnesenskii]XP_050478190.1 protein borderless isoform X2 [Bombus huntii]
MSRAIGIHQLLAIFLCYQAFGLILEEENEPNYLNAGVGEYEVFNCDLDFPHETPIPYILQWNRDGRTIFSWYNGYPSVGLGYEGRVHLLEDAVNRGYGQGSINLTNIRESDQGWYECRVIFPNRTPNSRNNGTWFHLAIDGETLLAVPPVNKTVMEGESVSFDCVAKGEKSVVNWFREGVEITAIEDLRRRASIAENGTLTINAPAMGDLGEYTCMVTGETGDQQSASAFLNVQYKAKVIYAPREVYLPYGKPALLDCHFRANPHLTNLRWEKDGFLFDPYNVQGVFYRRNGSLYFSKVDETHSGSYTCTPYNELGTDGPSPSITVVVQRPPVFTVTPQHLYIRKLGESLEIPCDARDGDQSHRPSIVWYKDGSPVPPGNRTIVIGGNLTIDRIQEQDRGLYQCAASNEAATVVADTELMVLNVPPRAPYNLSANSSNNAVTLTWVPGYVRPKMEYSVWYRPTDTTEWRTMKIVSRKITEATVNNLNPGREYEFMVLSQDKHGDGMFSKTLRIFTQPSSIDENSASEYRSPPDDRMGPPINVRVQATVQGYLVTWEPPAYGKEQVRLYAVRWFRGPSEQLYGRAETTDTYYLVKTLEEESYYTFEVAAMSMSDDVATSERVSLEVPAYRRNRAISMGIVAGIGFLAAALAAIWWAKKRFCQSSNEK